MRGHDGKRTGNGVMMNNKVIVIGDVMIDEYIWGDVNRICPEAPVPILKYRKKTIAPGGAANVAMNLAANGIDVTLVGVVGDDDSALGIAGNLHGINTELVYVKGRETTTKTRIMSQHQQMLRIDTENTKPYSNNVISDRAKWIDNHISEYDAVILSDYNKGMLPQWMIDHIILTAKNASKLIAVDPKAKQYTHTDIITPNIYEAQLMLHTDTRDPETLARTIRKNQCAKTVLLTLGENGIGLLDSADNKYYHIPTTARRVYNVTGAGDTVIAVYVAAILSGKKPFEAASLANNAACQVVSELDTASAKVLYHTHCFAKKGTGRQ